MSHRSHYAFVRRRDPPGPHNATSLYTRVGGFRIDMENPARRDGPREILARHLGEISAGMGIEPAVLSGKPMVMWIL